MNPAASHGQVPACLAGGRVRTCHRPKTPRGTCRRNDSRTLQVTARFDRGTFDEIAAFAAARGLSFNAGLRCLTVRGLKAVRNNGGFP